MQDGLMPCKALIGGSFVDVSDARLISLRTDEQHCTMT